MKTIYMIGSILCLFLQAVESYDNSAGDIYYTEGQAPDLTKKQNVTLAKNDPLKVLGKQDTYKLKSSWALTVSDQCLYEFVYQFEHPKDFPIGEDEHKDKCDFGTLYDPVKPKIAPEDDMPYLKPRRYWERFPNYVWATLGFNHISLDWQACGRKPMGYRQPQYDVSVREKMELIDRGWRSIFCFAEYLTFSDLF